MSASHEVLLNFLIVEDDPSTAILITEALVGIGVRPEIVSTCKDAYRALHRVEDGHRLEDHEQYRDDPHKQHRDEGDVSDDGGDFLEFQWGLLIGVELLAC